MDFGFGLRLIYGFDGLSLSFVVGILGDGHDALHLQGQLDTGLRGCYFNGVRELAVCVITSGTAGRPTRI